MTPPVHSDRWTWAAALGGAATMFAVQPPLDMAWGAWLAPIPWLALVAVPALPGRLPWLAIWIGGVVHWLFTIHWLRLPHPATGIGWVLLSAYLAVFLPLFVWLARRLVHARGWPLLPAAVVAWMACEQVRGTAFGGFTFAMLGHTQWRWTTLLQAADAVGAVGVGGIVMTVAAAVVVVVREGPRAASLGQAAVAAAIVAAATGYGAWRLDTTPPHAGRPLDVLLVQGSIDTELKHDPDAAGDVARHYDDLTLQGLADDDGRMPDLVIWPETMWRWPVVEIDPGETIPDSVVEQVVGPAGEDRDEAARQARCRGILAAQWLDPLAVHARRYGTRWLVGVDRQVVRSQAAGGVEHSNCGLFLDSTGNVLACYSKMHPVMFGEYIPLADRLPVLYRITPLPAGLTAGREPVAVRIAGFEVMPTICYETALPGAVRSMVRRLDATGRRPDVIVNLTNDGWFWGSSELDMHLTAAIFRAVELRTPIAIAANTGFSAGIDGSGRLLARGPRRDATTLRLTIDRDGRVSPWLRWGSMPIWLTVTVAVALAVLPAHRRG